MPGRPPAGGIPHGGRPGHPPPRRPPLAARHRQQAHPGGLHRRRRRPSARREAGSAAALVLARGDAGILDPSETAAWSTPRSRRRHRRQCPRAAATPPGSEPYQIADDDARTLVRLARRWCRILGLDPDAAPPAPSIETGISDLPRPSARPSGDHRRRRRGLRPAAPLFPPGRKAAQRDAENTARSDADRAAREVFGTDPARRHRHPRAPRRREVRRPPPDPHPARGHRRRPRHRDVHLTGPARPPADAAGAGRRRPARRPAPAPPPSRSPAPAAAACPPRRCGSASPATSPAP